MAYLVLARKWRPRDFSEVVGQGHVLRALSNALDSDRLHHAYLFTGTRGVGKTTLARVFAKCLNCERGVSSRPCGECSACRELDEGRFVDLIEVDAASRTGVDDTRELLDNVQYAPSKGRYKVYLIDEVHMFSKNSFNALLKTLEEPPPHIKFLLATTDPKKLPITILSRCLQLNLKRLGVEQIEEQLQAIAGREALPAPAPALRQLAVAADGSMRDALSLMDQAIAYCGGALDEHSVATMLGTLGTEQVLALVEALAAGDGAGLISLARQLGELAPDFAQVLADMLSILRRVAVVQTVGDQTAELAEDAAVLSLAERLSPQDCQLFYQMGLLARRDLPLAPDPQAGFEMALLRMLAFRPADFNPAGGTPPAPRSAPPVRPASTPSAAPKPMSAAPVTPAASASAVVPPVPPAVPAPSIEMPVAPPTEPALSNEAHVAPPLPPAAPAPVVAGTELDWPDLVSRLETIPLAREFARNCALRAFDGRQLEVVVSPQFQNLRVERTLKALEEALQNLLGAPVSLKVTVESGSGLATPAAAIEAAKAARQAAAESAIDADSTVQALQARFGATVEHVRTLP